MPGRITATHVTVICKDKTLSFKAVLSLAQELGSRCFSKTAYLVLDGVTGATTAGLAGLAGMRARLLTEGRDLRITGLRGQAKALYEIYRMGNLLPEAQLDRCRPGRSPSWLVSAPGIFTRPQENSRRQAGRVISRP